MKKIFTVFLTCMAAIAAYGKGGQYVLTVKDPEFVNGRYAYLGVEDIRSGNTEIVDSVLIAGNTARFEGNVKQPVVAYILTDTVAGTELPGGRKLVQGTAILEKGETELYRMAESLYPKTGCTPLNDLLASFITATANARNGLEEAETDEEATTLMNEYFVYLENVIHENRGNALGAYLLSLMSEEIPPAISLRLISEFPECEERFAEIKAAAQTALTVTVGNRYIDIAGINPDGTDVSLGSVVEGKGCRYVLVDFWASWCGPCMQQLKALKQLYDDYRDSGFEIYAVSSDFSREAWLEAIGKNRLDWTNIMADGGMGSTTYGKYAVSTIPSNFLIDCATGKIIAVNLFGVALEHKIDTLAKSNK